VITGTFIWQRRQIEQLTLKYPVGAPTFMSELIERLRSEFYEWFDGIFKTPRNGTRVIET